MVPQKDGHHPRTKTSPRKAAVRAGARGNSSKHEGRRSYWGDGKAQDSADNTEGVAVEGAVRDTKENASEQKSVTDFVVTEKRLWELHHLLNNRKGSLSSTYKKSTEANTKVYDLDQKTMQAVDFLAEKYEIFEETMKKVTPEEGDVLFAVAYEAVEDRLSVAILGQAISCSNVRMIFLRHELYWFCLVQVSTTHFCCFPPVLMARASDASDRPYSSSSIFGSHNGSALDLERTGSCSSRWEDEIQRNLLTTAAILAKRVHNRKSRPDACPDSGRYYDQDSHATPKKFRTISGVLGINWRIRLRFSSLRKLFFERFGFLVCSKFNHTQCGCTGACVVVCLHPHNSFRMLWRP